MSSNTLHSLRSITPFDSLSAFGVRIVQRDAFMADKRVPKAIKDRMHNVPGAFVIYCKQQSGATLLMAHDDTHHLCVAALELLTRA